MPWWGNKVKKSDNKIEGGYGFINFMPRVQLEMATHYLIDIGHIAKNTVVNITIRSVYCEALFCLKIHKWSWNWWNIKVIMIDIADIFFGWTYSTVCSPITQRPSLTYNTDNISDLPSHTGPWQISYLGIDQGHHVKSGNYQLHRRKLSRLFSSLLSVALSKEKGVIITRLYHIYHTYCD